VVDNAGARAVVWCRLDCLVVRPRGGGHDPAVVTPDPEAFAAAWLAAFNAHDLEAVLAHFADDVVFTTPVAVRALPETGGIVRGKDALRRYWTLALERVPDLRFEIDGVYAGIDTLVLNYRNQAGGQVCEVLTFDGDLVREGHATYLGASAQPGLGPGSPEEDLTLASYESAAERYLETSSPPGAAMVQYLDRFAGLVGAGHVLELGSGPGWDALHLEAQALQVTRSDATPAFLTRLRAAGHDARLLDMRTGDLGGPYDGVLANAVLLHLDRPQLETVLLRGRRAVTDEGTLGFTVKEGDGAAWTTAKLDQPRHFTYWREAALRDVLTRAGWSVHRLDHIVGRHEPWLYVLARASAAAADNLPVDVSTGSGTSRFRHAGCETRS